jgi:glycosyltransferase involved in cell wall biosynthesis
VSIVLPCHDEGANVERAIDEATAAGRLVADAHEVLVVDDGSSDQTRALAQARADGDAHVRVLAHDANHGYGAAVRTGLGAARLEWIALTDADLQFDLRELSRFLPLAASCDVIAGRRIKRADPLHRRVNAVVWNRLVGVLFGVRVHDVDCAFKLLRRDLVQGLRLTSEGAMVSTELLVRAQEAGARIAELAVGHRPRQAGRSSGASPHVVALAFHELHTLRVEMRAGRRPPAPAAAARPCAIRPVRHRGHRARPPLRRPASAHRR